MTKALPLLFLLASPCFGQSSYIVEDLKKEGQVQAFKMNIDNKYDVSGGTVTGAATFAGASTFIGTSTFVNSTNFSESTTFSSTVDFSDTVTFSGATSTATFSGWIDIGLEIIQQDCGSASNCTATCSAGKRVLGGGCQYVVNVFSEGFPSSNSTFFCAISNTQQLWAYAICARVK